MLKILIRHAAPWAFAWLAWTPAAAGELAPAEGVVAPLKQYQGWREAPVQDWREANDRVGEIGGWRTYLRESEAEEGPTGGQDNGHSGH